MHTICIVVFWRCGIRPSNEPTNDICSTQSNFGDNDERAVASEIPLLVSTALSIVYAGSRHHREGKRPISEARELACFLLKQQLPSLDVG